MTSNDPARYLPVLDHGLASLPVRMAPAQPVAVAVWAGPTFGAVVAIEDCTHDPDCSEDEHYVATTYTYRRSADGWQLPQGWGSVDWVGGTTTKAPLPDEQVRLHAFRTGGSSFWYCRTAEGLAGSSARWIELRDASGTTRHAVAPSGVVLVVTPDDGYPAAVRVLDGSERVLVSHDL